MKFRWRRRWSSDLQATPSSGRPARAARLSDEQVLKVIQDRLSEHFGPAGNWTVSQRTADDVDVIFREFLTRSLALELAGALRGDVAADAEQESAEEGTAEAKTTKEETADDWEPEPIAIWAHPDQSAHADQSAHPDNAQSERLIA